MKSILVIATSLALLIPGAARGIGFCNSCGGGATPASRCGYANTLWEGYCSEPIGCGGGTGCGTTCAPAMTSGASWWYGGGGCCGFGGGCGPGRSGFGFSGLGHTGFSSCGRSGGFGMGLGCGCGTPSPSYTLNSCGCGSQVATEDCGCDDVAWSTPASCGGFGQRHRCGSSACGSCGQSRMGLRQLFSRFGGSRNSGAACGTCCDFPAASYAPGDCFGGNMGCGAEAGCAQGVGSGMGDQGPHPADAGEEIHQDSDVPGMMETPVEDAAPMQETPMYEGANEVPLHEVEPAPEGSAKDTNVINPPNAESYTPTQTEALPEEGNKEAKRRPTPTRRWNIKG